MQAESDLTANRLLEVDLTANRLLEVDRPCICPLTQSQLKHQKQPDQSATIL